MMENKQDEDLKRILEKIRNGKIAEVRQQLNDQELWQRVFAGGLKSFLAFSDAVCGCLLDIGETEQVKKIAETGMSVYPQENGKWVIRAYLQNGEWLAALNIAQSLFSKGTHIPFFEVITVDLVDTMTKTGEGDRIESFLAECKQLLPIEHFEQKFLIEYGIARVKSNVGKYDEAIDILLTLCARRITSLPAMAGVYQLLGEIMTKTAQYDEAVKIYKEAIEYFSESPDARVMQIANMLFLGIAESKRGMKDDAKRILSDVDDLEDAPDWVKETALLHLQALA